MANLIDRVVVDFAKTFGRPGIFIAIDPKMERADKSNKDSQQVQAHDKNGGGLKWTATIAVVVKSFDREKYENLSITLTSPTPPANIAPGTPVMIDGLEQGLMKQSNGQYSQFWSAAAIRPVTMPAQPGQPASAAQR